MTDSDESRKKHRNWRAISPKDEVPRLCGIQTNSRLEACVFFCPCSGRFDLAELLGTDVDGKGVIGSGLPNDKSSSSSNRFSRELAISCRSNSPLS